MILQTKHEITSIHLNDELHDPSEIIVIRWFDADLFERNLL